METRRRAWERASPRGPFGCPYEEWKPIGAPTAGVKLSILSDVPMRNGNYASAPELLEALELSDVPMRNGNPKDFRSGSVSSTFGCPYEEWKRDGDTQILYGLAPFGCPYEEWKQGVIL